MIGKIRYPEGREYSCDDCNNAVERFKNKNEALAARWAVGRWSKDGRKCYCPIHAPNHRNVGRGGAPLPPEPQPDWLPAGYKQLKLDV